VIEYWAVIGLACLDDEFRQELTERRNDGGQINKLMKEHGFRLSLYELGEVQRLMKIEGVREAMKTIYELEWSEFCICITSKTFNTKYLHPHEGGKGEIVLSPIVSGSGAPSEQKFALKKKGP
jgi:hypothetical protein